MSTVITFSGMVGSGKSVCSRYLGSSLSEEGFPVYYLRFRFVSLKSFFEKKRKFKKFVFKGKEDPPSAGAPEKETRFRDFKLKSNLLFAARMPYYAWKACLFFLLVKVRYPKDIVIADRYIYDHLVHYRLGQRKYRAMYRAFLKMLPQPDIAFVLASDFETIVRARPMYAEEYVRLNLANYKYLKELHPGAVLVAENEVKEKIESVFNVVKAYLT